MILDVRQRNFMSTSSAKHVWPHRRFWKYFICIWLWPPALVLIDNFCKPPWVAQVVCLGLLPVFIISFIPCIRGQLDWASTIALNLAIPFVAWVLFLLFVSAMLSIFISTRPKHKHSLPAQVSRLVPSRCIDPELVKKAG